MSDDKTRPSMVGSPARSEVLDPDFCAVKSCHRDQDMIAYGVGICDWHLGIVCDKRTPDPRSVPDAIQGLLPVRDRHHVVYPPEGDKTV